MPYIKARPSANNSANVIYTSSDGSLTVWYSGSRAWRNNNPGNIRYTPFAKRHGAIGKAGGFAVFPDYNTGRAALSALLRGPTYADRTIFKAVETYAPSFQNDTAQYRLLLAQFTRLDIDRKLHSLDGGEFEILLDAIQRIEGWVVGEQKPMKKVIRTKRTKMRRLSEFLIEGSTTFVSLATAIQMAKNDDIEAVIVRTNNGTAHLRNYPDSSGADNFQSLAD